ncbi:MAG TPA: hypothetical protein VH280_14875 [Verrucomicrobiae bacterium]|nr:hypothetical protein [Verrucomicrobiae bacterium]
MTSNDCIEFVDGLAPEELASTEHRLNQIMSEGDPGDPGWLSEGLARGHYKITTSHNAGKPVYRYAWHVSDQNYLHVNASLFVGQPGENDDWLWMIGAELIARQNKCRGICFESQRRGHLVQGQRAGFKVAGVRMIKTLENVPS